jgi:hypothetical protein
MNRINVSMNQSVSYYLLLNRLQYSSFVIPAILIILFRSPDPIILPELTGIDR